MQGVAAFEGDREMYIFYRRPISTSVLDGPVRLLMLFIQRILLELLFIFHRTGCLIVFCW